MMETAATFDLEKEAVYSNFLNVPRELLLYSQNLIILFASLLQGR